MSRTVPEPQEEQADPPLSGPHRYPGQWHVQHFEESCGKLWRWDVRVSEGRRESRRVEVRKL